jgi:hypothetical protein
MPIRTAGYARRMRPRFVRERGVLTWRGLGGRYGGACDVPNDDSHDASDLPTPTDASLLVARGWFCQPDV